MKLNRFFVIFLSIYLLTAEAHPLGHYLPLFQTVLNDRNSVITSYFNLGLSYTEIAAFLASFHGVVLSVRQLKRILRRLGRRRRLNPSDAGDVLNAIICELSGSGSIIGYRAMHQRMRDNHGLIVTRETVRQVFRIVDPDGVEARLKHRHTRRNYKVRGPNDRWHIDGYDKLKPFGFCVHGAIDGYSRRILWLEVSCSNNDPTIIVKYYVDYVRQVSGTARVVRGDKGTENTHVATIQRYLRALQDDSFSGDNSFIYGKSTSNQRIESWWSQLRRGCADWWISYFKDLEYRGLCCNENIIHVECLKFCFMSLIQTELHEVAKLWNTHFIRPSHNENSPSGRPDTLYCIPEATGTANYLVNVENIDIEIVNELCCQERSTCLPEFEELALIVMEERGLSYPNNHTDAKHLYLELLNDLENMEVN